VDLKEVQHTVTEIAIAKIKAGLAMDVCWPNNQVMQG